MSEEVDHPAHYGGDDVYEVIKVLEAWDLELAKGFCWGNLVKYTARAGKKGSDAVGDRLKAEWYAQRLATIETTLAGRNTTAAEKQPVPPAIGSEWIWKKDSANARCRVRVTQVDYLFANTKVEAKVITRDRTQDFLSRVSAPVHRWYEVATPAPSYRLSWEKEL